MDNHTYDNWKKIKEVMEKTGNTNNNFYTRACAIMITRKDPMESFFKNK